MDPDTGSPLDTLTPQTQQLIQDLGSQNTKVSKIIAQDRAVFAAIQEGLDRANQHATSRARKVGIPSDRMGWWTICQGHKLQDVTIQMIDHRGASLSKQHYTLLFMAHSEVCQYYKPN